MFFGGILTFLLMTLSACGFRGEPAGDTDNWKDEILLAHECGMDGLPCCPDEDESCFYGQVCCTDPGNMKRNYCADNCACGEFKKFCCADEPRCDAGMACAGGYCLACGGDGEPCCDGGEPCGSGLVCHGGSCRECGFTGNPCCDGDTACRNEKNTGEDRVECQNGVCVSCGFGGNTACLAEPCCASGHLLNGGACIVCGGHNRPCCAPDPETGERCNNGLVCELGFCN